MLLVCSAVSAKAKDILASYDLTRIDQGSAWVSPYWGYNAPKLIYDGVSFYTVGLWGEEQAAGRGVVYKREDGIWRRGFTSDGFDYQPGLLLLDRGGHLILIYPRMGRGPTILRSANPGDIDQFHPIEVPDTIAMAGYLGAGIYDDRIVIGYIGEPATYSFNVAMLDLKTGLWEGPRTIAPAQRKEEPWTTWLYPIIQPDATGVHIAVSNNADASSYYDRILYIYLPYETPETAQPEEVIRVQPWTGNLAFAAAMWRTTDGTVYITGQYKPQGRDNRLYVFQRHPSTRLWREYDLSPAQVATIFQDAAGIMWLTSTYGSGLKLYRSADGGISWEEAKLPEFGNHDLVSTFFLHGISPSSGSLMPDTPTAVFSAGSHPNYQMWFVQFDTIQNATAILGQGSASPLSPVTLSPNYPNPFNLGTSIHFTLHQPALVTLVLHNLAGQQIGKLTHGHLEAGRHTVHWNGLDKMKQPLPTGVYFCRLQTTIERATQKLLLLR